MKLIVFGDALRVLKPRLRHIEMGRGEMYGEVGTGDQGLASGHIRLQKLWVAGLTLGLMPKFKGILGLEGPGLMGRGWAGGLRHSLSSN